MNRRSFLSALATIAGVAVADPEKLLWTPGKKLISIPQPLLVYRGRATEIIQEAFRLNGIVLPYQARGFKHALDTARTFGPIGPWGPPALRLPRTFPG